MEHGYGSGRLELREKGFREEELFLKQAGMMSKFFEEMIESVTKTVPESED